MWNPTTLFRRLIMNSDTEKYPCRYVGAAEVEDDGEPFEEKMARLSAALREQTEQSEKFDQIIWANLEDIGYGG